MIYIRTHAYNAEKTLKRAIDSILRQTYPNFEYHILDNGSTDKTGDIIREYAKRDKRIVPYFNKVNHAHQENPDFWNLSKRIPEGDYFCILDADDAYAVTFFQEMLNFMEENHLEIAACGTVFLDSRTGKALGTTVLKHNVIANTPRLMSVWFPTIHWNLRQVWGKLYSSRAAAARYETELPDWFPKAYGGDTINVMQCVRAVKQFGVYAKALHYYTVSTKSVSYQWIPGREKTDLVLHQKAVEFLQDCCGSVAEKNMAFLYAVYWYAIIDTCNVLVKSNLSSDEQIRIMINIVSRDITRHIFRTDMGDEGIGMDEKETFLKETVIWLIFHAGKDSTETIPIVEEICRQLNPDFSQLIPAEQLLWYIQNMPLVVTALALCEYEAALQRLVLFVEKEKGNVFVIVLIQTLAALLQKQDVYVLYEKLLISQFIEENDLQKAEEELAEWEQILPGDEELVKLRGCLDDRKAQ